tara:strand:+ start:2426 stop:4465 length:2040 start_codon:yes stop_codon:yes gene_type:complete
MAKVTPIQTNFTGGEISPRLRGRVDLTKYTSSLAHCENFVVFPHGGVTKRSGTRFVVEVKDSSKETRLVPFIFSTVQAYILEFGDYYVRFVRNEGQIQNGANPYEIASPYSTADLEKLDFTQSADILFICHPDYETRKLSRTGHTSWGFTNFNSIDGPFGDVNTSATTLTPSATSGTSVTVTASAVTGINDNQGFLTTDVGRHIRILSGGKWGSSKIIARTSSTVVTVSTFTDFNFGATTATDNWRLGIWSDTTGWPTTATFYQQRLFFANNLQSPNTVWASESGNFETFSPTNNEAEVLDDSGLDLTLATDQVNAIRWMYGAKQLQLGTSDGPFIMSSGSDNLALTPSNVTSNRETTDGTTTKKPIGASRATIFIDRTRTKIRELAYNLEVDGFATPDLTLIAEHITTGNVKELAYTRSPDSLIWALLDTGQLRCLTYERAQDVVAWHRHTIGGTNSKVKSIAAIPSFDELEEQLYMIVERTINGVTKKYIEFLEKSFDQAKGDTPETAFFVDSGLSYSGTAVTSLSGLSHLEGETVKVLVNGANHPDKIISGGSVTLDRPATTASIGLGYEAIIRTLDPEVQTESGPSQGKTRRVERVTARVVDTYNLEIGTDLNAMQTVFFRTPSIPMGSLALFTGDKRLLLDFTPNREFDLYMKHKDPLPCTILAVMYALVVSER